MENSNAVTWAMLGLIALRPRSGYDIKRIVDRSIRHFWAASYGQIYPELKRLGEAGWIGGDHAPHGERVGLRRGRAGGLRGVAGRRPSPGRGLSRPHPAVRRPRLPLGAGLLRMGDRMVRPTGAPVATGSLTELPEPTWRMLLSR